MANLSSAYAAFHWTMQQLTRSIQQEANNIWIQALPGGMKPDETTMDHFQRMVNVHSCLASNGHITMERQLSTTIIKRPTLWAQEAWHVFSLKIYC